jgi:hypothetical protein
MTSTLEESAKLKMSYIAGCAGTVELNMEMIHLHVIGRFEEDALSVLTLIPDTTIFKSALVQHAC